MSEGLQARQDLQGHASVRHGFGGVGPVLLLCALLDDGGERVGMGAWGRWACVSWDGWWFVMDVSVGWRWYVWV